MSAELVGLLAPYVTAAVKAYGAAVLDGEDAADAAADATAGVGRRILRRIFSSRPDDDDREVPGALADLATDPEDGDLQAVLRVQIRKALAADEQLAQEVGEMLAQAPAAGVSVTASGERSIAAHTISGVAVTGDDSKITR